MRAIKLEPWVATVLAAVVVGSAHAGPPVLRARAVIQGPGGIEGVVLFKQKACPKCSTPDLNTPPTDPALAHFPEPTVQIVADISGPPGALAEGAHGLHIHEAGACDAALGFASAGGHFDPGPFGNPQPDANHPFHMGDMPNLIVGPDGRGSVKHTTSRITLSAGPLSVFDANGSAVIVHGNPDRGTTGVSGGSGGPRIACGIIEQATTGPDDDD